MQSFRDAFGQDISLSGLVIVAGEEEYKYMEKHAIFEDIITRRKQLETKNRILTGLKARFVTNAVSI